MAEYADRESNFNASLGHVMGTWESELSKADLIRQQGWLEAVQALAKPDKDGNIPTITLASGIKGPDNKPISGADISFPIVLALMGEQFAADTASLSMTMNVSASTLDETKGQQEGGAEGEAKFGIAGLSATVKVHASFSESEDHKRESDYRATTTANLTMKRVKTPEPIQRVLQAFMRTVDVECQLASALIEANAKSVAQQKGLLPPDSGGDQPTPTPAPQNGNDN